MPIQSTELIFFYSTGNATSFNSVQNNPNASLGGFRSSARWLGGHLNDLFSNISGANNASLTVDFRCVFINNNNNNSLTLQNALVWIDSDVFGGAHIALGADPTPASIAMSSSPQAVTIPNTLTAPSGVSFSSPITSTTGVSLGDIPAGYCKAFWIQRTATNSIAINNDGFSLGLGGDTAANAPTLISVTPNVAGAGTLARAIFITCIGTNFTPLSVAYFGPIVITTTFVNSSTLTVTITSGETLSPEIINVSILDSGTMSNSLPFTVMAVSSSSSSGSSGSSSSSSGSSSSGP